MRNPRLDPAAFAARAPSAAWESVPLAEAPGQHVWVWYKPQGMHDRLLVTVPEETWAANPSAAPLTMRRLLQAVGVEPAAVTVWTLSGATCESRGGTNPLLDQPLPPPVPGADPRIAVYVQPVPFPAPVPAAAPVSGPAPTVPAPADVPPAPIAAASPQELLTRIETDWRAIVQIEANLMTVRRQLSAVLARLGVLNRDLTPEERSYSDRQDRSDWQAARRWLRESATNLSRWIKEHDMGQTSSAGKRNWFEQVYQGFVAPRRLFEGLERVQKEFEFQRKVVQILLNNMHAAHAGAVQDGERRAEQVLDRIAAKVRTGKARR